MVEEGVVVLGEGGALKRERHSVHTVLPLQDQESLNNTAFAMNCGRWEHVTIMTQNLTLMLLS